MPVPKGVSKEKFDSCVEQVKSKQKGKVNAYAVCNSSLGKSYNKMRNEERETAGGDKKFDKAELGMKQEQFDQVRQEPQNVLAAVSRPKAEEVKEDEGKRKEMAAIGEEQRLRVKGVVSKSMFTLEPGMSWSQLRKWEQAETLSKPKK